MTTLKTAKATYLNTDIGLVTMIKETTPQGSIKVLRSVTGTGVKSPPSLYNYSHRAHVFTRGLSLQDTNRFNSTNNQVNNAISTGVVPSVSGNISNGNVNNRIRDNSTTGVASPKLAPPTGLKPIGITGQPDYAALAQNTYKGEETQGYVIDPFFSDEEATVYVANNGKAILAFKGTQPRNTKQAPSDIVADYHIVQGVEENSYEFQHALRKGVEVVQKYGLQNVVVVGHSLGGTKAMYVSHKLGIHAEVYNAGWSPADIFRHTITIPKWAWSGYANERPQEWNLSNVTSHIELGDAVSNSQLLQPGLKLKVEGASSGLAKTGLSIGAQSAIGVGAADVAGTIAAGMGFGPAGVAIAAGAVGLMGIAGIIKDSLQAHDISNFVTDKKLKSQQKAFVSHPLGGYDIGASRSRGNAWGFA